MKVLTFVIFLFASATAAADPTALLTVGEADRMIQESNSIITTSVGAVAFFLGWVAGAST